MTSLLPLLDGYPLPAGTDVPAARAEAVAELERIAGAVTIRLAPADADAVRAELARMAEPGAAIVAMLTRRAGSGA